MFTTALIDIDGVINHATRFSDRYSAQYNIPITALTPFFTGPFKECLIGKRDLKEAIAPFLKDWGWKGTVDELLEYWLAGEVNPNQEIVTAINDLHRKGIKCIGASNQEHYRMNYLREALHLNGYIDAAYASSELGYAKPQPEFFTAILTDLKLQPAEVVFWDDDAENVASAQQLGITSYHYIDQETFLKQLADIF